MNRIVPHAPPWIAALVATAVAPCTLAAPQPIPGLFNTGLDASGQALPAGSMDPHYTLVESADAGAPGPAAFVVNEGFPIPPWIGNSATSKWIAPTAAQGTGNAAGDYTYRLTFSLDDFLPGTATITGQWTSDNGGPAILLNGAATGQSQSGNFGAFSPFSITGGFVAGTNTLDFVVTNAGDSANPTGLRVELSGSAEPEPPPNTPPIITDQPTGLTAAVGEPALFRVTATGSSPLAYQWRKNGAPIPGATAAIFTIAAVSPSDAGDYTVVVSNGSGTATSAPPAVLTVSFDQPSPAELSYEAPGPTNRRSGLTISEIHYHPADRTDGRNLEFVEIHNTNPWPADVAGYRIDGDWSYTFPAGASIPADGYRVVASAPADIAAVYGVADVLGPAGGSLSNGGGTVRLRKPAGAILLEVDYGDAPPWPVAADGAGHALALVRPSFGESDPRAWAAGAAVGGSPGSPDPVPTGPLEHVSISAVSAHSGGGDFIELTNLSFAPADVSGCLVSDDRGALARFVIPPGTNIPPNGTLRLAAAEIGFGLAAAGGTVYFTSANAGRVIDALAYPGMLPGAIYDREAGAPSGPVVINEIMFNPPGGGSEFVELTNTDTSPIDLTGWQFTEGISFTFTGGVTLAPGGFLVVARDRARLLTDHPGLDPARVVGDYGGSLANGGEGIALGRPAEDTEAGGTFLALADEVAYSDGGRWGRYADGGGSSLELVDPLADNRLAPNWADSDESAKAPWTTVAHTGVLDLGTGSADQLHVFMLGESDALVDDIEVVPAGGANAVANGTFAAGTGGWDFSGTHRTSGVESGALHLRAVDRGDYGPNKARTDLTAVPAAGSTATIRARARWLGGHPEILLRLKGSYLEATAPLAVPKDLGTPGAPNSRRAPGAPPAITDVVHRPVLPDANVPVRVTARSTGATAPELRYRIDPGSTTVALAMSDDGSSGDLVAGDGVFSAILPGQPDGTLAAFTVGSFPDGGREAYVRWGDGSYGEQFGTYRIWMTEATHAAWTAREKLCNDPLPVTFVYNGDRVIYGASALFSGSAFTSPGYTTPTGRICGYNVTFPKDDPFLGDDGITLDFPVRDPTAQREQLMYWFLDRFGLSNNYRRYVNVFVNGVGNRERSGWGPNSNAIYEDVQQPGGDMIDEFYPDHPDGTLFKSDYWHEFDNAGNRTNPVIANTLEDFTTTGGAKKTARYRWNWKPRATGGPANNYAPIFDLVDAFNTDGAGFAPSVAATVDIENWMRTFVVADLASNWDSFGNPGGKNTFLYRPDGGAGWQLMSWDFDVGLGVFNDPTDFPTFSIGDPVVRDLYSTPVFLRAYWRAMDEALSTFYQPPVVSTVLDPKFAAFQAAGVPLADPDAASGAFGLSIPGFVAERRAFLLGELAGVAANFAITTNGGADFSTPAAVVSLAGTAPVSAAGIAVGGIARPVTWTATTGWEIDVVLAPGTHVLTVAGVGAEGSPIPGMSDTITVTRTGAPAPEPAAGTVVINEILYAPGAGGSAFVEIFNRSATTAFDLTGWRINGLGFSFPPGTVLAPGGFVVVADGTRTFGETYGFDLRLAGVFTGTLDPGGETLTLFQPDGAGGEVPVDVVRYDPAPPWPAGAASGTGIALQLIDPAQDNNRPGNWAATAPSGGPAAPLVELDAAWRYNQSGSVPANWAAPAFDDSAWASGAALHFVESAALPGPKNTPLTLGQITYYFRTTFEITGTPPAGLALTSVLDDGMVAYLNGTELTRVRMDPGSVTNMTLARPPVGDATLEGPDSIAAPTLQTGTNTLAVEVHQSVLNSSDVVFGLEVASSSNPGLPATPGAVNSFSGQIAPIPNIWLNELQTRNGGSVSDSAGDSDAWTELYNGEAAAVDLTGWSLESGGASWSFPAGTTLGPGGFLLVWLDAEPGEATAPEPHATFAATPGAVVVLRDPDGVAVDAIADTTVLADTSSGRFPDGDFHEPATLFTPTPGAPNSLAVPPPPVFINEWMAANDGSVPDPADGDADDWFELYNAGASAVDLSGYTLTDDLAAPAKYAVPNGVTIEGGGFLLVWADDEPGQFTPGGSPHATFRLSASGEEIGLFTPDGALVDSVTFGAAAPGTTSGRWPDGGDVFALVTATPGGLNILAPPTPPALPAIGASLTPGGDVELDFATELGRYYQGQASADLESWTPLGPRRPGFGDPLSITDPAPSGPRRFYRIKID